MSDGDIENRVADDRVAFFNGITMDRGLGNAAGEDRNLFHPSQGFFRPGDGVLGLRIDRRYVLAIGHQDVTGGAAQQVFRVAADIHVFIAMDADAADDEQPGCILADVLDDFFKGFAVKQGRFDVGVLGLGNFTGNIEV